MERLLVAAPITAKRTNGMVNTPMRLLPTVRSSARAVLPSHCCGRGWVGMRGEGMNGVGMKGNEMRGKDKRGKGSEKVQNIPKKKTPHMYIQPHINIPQSN